MTGQKDLLVQLVRKEKTAKDEEAYDTYCHEIFNEIGEVIINFVAFLIN
jgi:hypothetical protein